MPSTGRLLNELEQNPLMKSNEARPTPPVPTVTRVGVQIDDVLMISLDEAIRRALENNNDIEVARGDVRVAEGTLRSLEGVYDPDFVFNPQFTNSVTPTTSSIGGAGSSGTVAQNGFQFNSTVTKQFSKGGGQYQFFFNNLRQSTSSTLSRLNPFYSASLGVTFTQPLWRNRSIDSYRHAIRVERKKVSQTDAQFRLTTTQIINQVQHAYWELVFALNAQKVALDSLNLARDQFYVTEQGVAAGTTAPLSRAEIDTQIAVNEASLLAAAKAVALAENSFKQLVLRDSASPEWKAAIIPTDTPSFDLTPVNLNDALMEARANRPELRNLRVQAEINQLDLQFARNQTRPRIDIASTISTTGLAGSPVSSTQTDGITGLTSAATINGQVPLISGDPNQSANAFLLSQINQVRSAQGLGAAQVPLVNSSQVAPNLVGGYGRTLRNLSTFGTRDIVVGVVIEIPFRNRTAEGNLAVARAQRDQVAASLRSQEQAVESDVRNTVQTLETARQTVLTARLGRESAELQLAGELQLFRAGQSTTFLVFQRENTLASARNTELRSEADYNNALADLQRATGTTIRSNNLIVETPAGP
jgi:outer membrane protein TolC